MTKNNDEIKDKIKSRFWLVYNKNTSTLSSICRQLAFAEGGICWFFLTFEGSCISNVSRIPIEIKIILIFLVLFFIFDALQYLILATYNKIFAEFYEQKLEEEVIKNVDQM